MDVVNPVLVLDEPGAQPAPVRATWLPPPGAKGLPATVGDLPCSDYAAGPDVLTEEVAEELDRRPDVPGVLIIEDGHYIGMVSRRRCLEMLSQPYGVEVFLRRPLFTLYEHIGARYDLMPADTRIDRAVHVALDRPLLQLYEPLVVTFGGDSVKLLDLHTLLLAQSDLLANANSLIRRQVEIGRALSSTLELSGVLTLILEHLVEIVPCNRAAVLLQEGRLLEFAAWRGFPPETDMKQLRIPVVESEVYQAICFTRQPLSIPDVLQRPEWRPLDQFPATRAWAGVPLVHSGYVVGMLSLTRLVPDGFSLDELALAQTFAEQAVVALQNARLYDQIKRFSQDLEGMVQERTEALEAAYNKLEHLDRTKSDFIGVTSHELRTPLTVISGYVQMLLADQAIRANRQQADMLSGISTGLTRMHEVVNSMLDVVKIDSRELRLGRKPMEMAWLMKSLEDEFTPLAAERKLGLFIDRLEDLPSIQGDVDALRKVFYHLIVNAIKYTPDGGRVYVTGSFLKGEWADKDGDAVHVIVGDTGIGIDPENHELIFEKFYQTGQLALHSSGKTKFKGGGPGLGLAIARGIVEAHGGRIWVESPAHDEQKLPGSQFHVVLPAAAPAAAEEQRGGRTSCKPGELEPQTAGVIA